MTECRCGTEHAEQLERRALIILLLLNAGMFLAELAVGWLAESSGLIADSLDMLADATVYGVSLCAVGQGLRSQAASARLSGLLQISLGALVLLDVVRRLVLGNEPESLAMIAVAGLALLVNTVCLWIIARHRRSGVHMRAAWIFSANDVLANLGVMLSGALVYLLESRYPDLLIGTLIAMLVVRGGLRILAEAREAERSRLRA